jgi:hypothetical protein
MNQQAGGRVATKRRFTADSTESPSAGLQVYCHTMRMQNLIALSALGLLAAVAGGCSQKPDVVVTITVDRGTNVTTITTNGYTVMTGSTVVGTNVNTNAAPATKPPP